MDGLELLAQAHAAGLRVQADGDVLVVTGAPDTAALAKELIECKADILPLLQAEGTGSPPTAESTVLAQAMLWLSTMLASGPQPESELMPSALAEGISKGTLRRAKAALGIQSKRQGKRWVWVSLQGAQGQGAHHPQDAHQDAQDQDAQGAHPIASKPFVSANVSQCRRCNGTNWGPKPNADDTWWCLDCASLPVTTPAPRADDRDAYACPGCGPYTLVRDARRTVCYRCRRRF